MALNHPQDRKPEEAHWEFLGVVRKFDMEKKLDQPLPELYTTHGTFRHTYHDAYPEEAYDDLLEQLEKQRFYDLGGPNWKGRVDQYDFDEKFIKPKPIDLFRSYQRQPELREFLDHIVEYCPKPTFVPVRKWHFRKVRKQTFKHKAFELSAEAFVLSHAVQVLLFAPQDFSPHRVYSRDSTKYEHRFPTPEFIGGGTNRFVAGMFSMEDLHRAILMFYYLVSRRKQDDWIGMVPEDNDLEFPGYHDPDGEDGDSASEAELPDEDD